MTLGPESAGRADGRGRLTGRRVVVVGAGTRPSPDPELTVGNGHAIAVLCAREGASVACVDVNKEAAKITTDMCAREVAASVPVVADVRDAGACEPLVKEAHEKPGGLDGVEANVGFGGRQRPNRNITGVVGRHLCGQRALTFSRRARRMPLLDDGGTFVFIGSAAGLKAGTRFPAYDSSKAARFGLTRHVALEGAPRSIRANHVIPGPVDTPLGRVGDASVAGRTKIRWPLGRQATAWDIAYATVFMLSAESAYTTAQSL